MLKFEALENYVKKFCSQNDLSLNPETMECTGQFAYMRIDRIPKFMGDRAYYTLHAVCGIRTMGEFEPKDMVKAHGEIGKILQTTSWINRNCEGVQIFVDIQTEEPLKEGQFYEINGLFERN